MKKYIFTAIFIFAASSAFSQSKTVQEGQFANAPQQWDNEMITIQNVEVSLDAAAPHLKNKCQAPKSFDVIELKFKGGRPDFKPCFLISHQMLLMMTQKAGGNIGKFDVTFKGNETSGYLVNFMVHKGR